MINAKTAKRLSNNGGDKNFADKFRVEAQIKEAALRGKRSCLCSPLREDIREELRGLGYKVEYTDDYTYYWYRISW